MITLGTIAFRYIEAGYLVLLLVATLLLFLKRRPAGLVWVCAVLVATMAVHLYLEQGRWQLVPAYALGLIEAFWLARPAGMPYRSARPYRVPGLIARIVVLILVAGAVLVPVVVPIFVIAPPASRVGSAKLYAPASDAAPDGDEAPRRAIRIWYPASEAMPTVAPFWDAEDLSADRLPGLPAFASTHLTLVPTPAGLRAPIAGGELPLLVIVAGEGSIPGDYLDVAVAAASDGWFVARPERVASAQDLIDVLDYLSNDSGDLALDRTVDPTRLVLLLGSGAPQIDIGVPSVTIGADGALTLALASGRFELSFGDLVVPSLAYTTRYLLVRPWRLTLGSSDITPRRAVALMRRVVDVVLADGSAQAPVFSALFPEPGRIVEGFDDAVIRPLPDDHSLRAGRR